MSSPRTVTAKASAKTSRAAKKSASDEGMSRADKVNFISAMMDGLPSKDAPAKTRTEKVARKASANKPLKVEILRKISAPVIVATPSNALSDEARKFAAAIEDKVASGDFDALTPEAVQALMTALCKFYSCNVEAGNKFAVVKDRHSITGTDAMITCGALLKAVDLQVFELGMWQSWSGL